MALSFQRVSVTCSDSLNASSHKREGALGQGWVWRYDVTPDRSMNLTLGVAPRAFPPWKMPGYRHSLHDNVSWLRITVISTTHLLYACYLYKEKHAIRGLLSPIPASRTNKYVGNAPLPRLLVQVVLDIRTIRSLVESTWLSWVSCCIGVTGRFWRTQRPLVWYPGTPWQKVPWHWRNEDTSSSKIWRPCCLRW